jgi:PAS domain S-box-containing protein
MTGEASLDDLSGLDLLMALPIPTQVFDHVGARVLENTAFKARFRATGAAPELAALVDSSHGGRPSAFQAALAGHHRAVPLGAAAGASITAHYYPLQMRNDGTVSHVQVMLVETQVAAASAAEGTSSAPTLYATAHSTAVEAQLRFIVDNVPQLIWSTLPDGYHDFYNRRWYEYIGASPAQTQGAGWNDPLHPDDQQDAWIRWHHSLATGDPYEIEYRFRRHDGTYRWFLGRAAPMRDEAGNIVRWFGTCTDIDEQKRTEQAREEAMNALEEATRLKDEFLASASHELRTPLNAILGWARMLRERPELATKAMAVIERNAEAQARLVNDLLDMTSIIAGKVVIETESVWNLVSNAVKFTPPEGSVSIMARREGSNVVVAVTDTGKGIAPSFLPFVFDRFRQADGSATRREGGLGLGLAIAKHIVELHGGTLSVQSDGLGKGATFAAVLPNLAVSPRAPVTSTVGSLTSTRSAPTPFEVRLDHVRVLIVDDERDARELVSAVVMHVGASTDLADSVEAALRLVEERSPDIVVSDIGMPDRGGIDLVTELRRRHFSKPTIALTALARADDRARALKAGFDEHLAKPVEPTTLIATIARLLRR